MPLRLTIDDIVAHARECVSARPSEQMQEAVEQYAAVFSAERPAVGGKALNLFTFHVQVPESHRVIDYVDVKHDHGAFDYRRLISHFIWAGNRFNRSVQVYYVTSMSCLPPESHATLTLIRLATDNRAPMLERVKAMAGYVFSAAFDRDTVFLDTDAYPNRSLESIFDKSFDIGVTYRTTPGFMPLNEGVIFCSVSNRDAIQRFFSSYLGTYEKLRNDPLIQKYYGDVDRWRGGQLSLNAVACPTGNIAQVRDFESGGIRIKLFSCNTFNYWVTRLLQPGMRSWDRKYVLHLKGDSKRWLMDHVEEYQRSRAAAHSARAVESAI